MTRIRRGRPSSACDSRRTGLEQLPVGVFLAGLHGDRDRHVVGNRSLVRLQNPPVVLAIEIELEHHPVRRADEIARALLDQRAIGVFAVARSVAHLDAMPHPLEQVSLEPLVITRRDVQDHSDVVVSHTASLGRFRARRQGPRS